MAEDVGTLLGSVDGWDVLWAALVVLVGWLASRAAGRGVRALLQRLKGFSPAAVALSARLVKYVVMLLAIGVALSFLGAPLQPLLAAAVVVGVVLVLALRGVSDNFAAGVVLQTRLPVRIGDDIGTGGHRGVVTEMNGRSVVITTTDGRVVHLPNSGVLQNALTNYSESGGNRAEIEVRMLVPPDGRDEQYERIRGVVSSVPEVDGRRHVRLLAVLEAPDRVTVRVRFWHRPHQAAEARSGVVTAVSRALRSAEVAASVTSVLPAPPLTPPAPV